MRVAAVLSVVTATVVATVVATATENGSSLCPPELGLWPQPVFVALDHLLRFRSVKFSNLYPFYYNYIEYIFVGSESLQYISSPH